MYVNSLVLCRSHVCFKSFFLMSSPKENVMVIFDLLAGKEETVI